MLDSNQLMLADTRGASYTQNRATFNCVEAAVLLPNAHQRAVGCRSHVAHVLISGDSISRGLGIPCIPPQVLLNLFVSSGDTRL